MKLIYHLFVRVAPLEQVVNFKNAYDVLHSYFAGSYMFVDASDRNPEDEAEARLLSGWMEANETVCLQFWYRMHGSDISNLNIFMKTNQSGTPVWKLAGDQGNRWRLGQTALNSPNLYRVSCKQPRKVSKKSNLRLNFSLKLYSIYQSRKPCSFTVKLNEPYPSRLH